MRLRPAGTTVAAADTDGIDGRADAAGGLVDATTVTDAGDAPRLGGQRLGHAPPGRRRARRHRPHRNVNDLGVVVLTDEY